MLKWKLVPLAVTIALLLLSIGLAVPSINVEVQGIGAGSCGVKSPTGKVNVAVEWNVTQTWNNRYRFVLNLVNLTFDAPLPAGSRVYVNMTVYGTTTGTRNPTNHIYSASATLPAQASSYSFQGSDFTTDKYVYRSNNPVRYPIPKVTQFRIVITDGYNTCEEYTIEVSVQKLGFGNMQYTPPGKGLVNITVTEQKGQDLTDYVINFTLPGDWSGRYPYVYDVNDSTRLYYWYYYDTSSNKTWFWVKLNLNANQIKLLQLHYGDPNGYNPDYNNPRKVFWYYNDTTLTTEANYAYLIGDFRSNVSQYSTDGYVLITRASLGSPSNNENGPAYFVFYGKHWKNWQTLSDTYYGETLRLRNGGYRRRIVRWEYQNGGLSYTGGTRANGIVVGAYLMYQLVVDNSSFTVNIWQNGTHLWNRDFQNDVSWRDTLVGLSPLYLGQIDSGTSYYAWRAVRPYVNPEPKVEIQGIGSEWNGNKYVQRFVIYLRP